VKDKIMPGGHASHKGSSNKPNINAEGKIDTATDKSLDPEARLLEGVVTNTTRTQEFVDYPPAIQRPDEEMATEKEET
jgi:hypothetical protein